MEALVTSWYRSGLRGTRMSTTTTVRPLGKTGMAVSPLGLAAFSMASHPRPKPSGLTPNDVERAFHEFGINTFLVHYLMPALMKGVRNLIRAGHRDDLVLVSEVGVPTAGSVRRALNLHLRLLGTDHLDVWLFGWVRSRRQVRTAVWASMQRLKQQGRTRALGFSTHNRLLAAELTGSLTPDVLMIRYNAAHRGAERELFATLPSNPAERPGIIAYTATRWGMLLNGVPARGFPEGMTAAECYRFALANAHVDTVWCAARSFEELTEDVAGVAAGPLPHQRYQEVCRFGDAVHAVATGGRRWMFGRDSQ